MAASADLQRVYDLVRIRLAEPDPQTSYVAALTAKGADAVLRKIAEESTELLLAAKDGDRDAAVHELADLVFHLLVWMATTGITPEDLERELGARFGKSGLKASP